MKTAAEHFWHCCQSGDLDAVKQLIVEEGIAVVNATDEGGMNGLMHGTS